MLKNCKKFLKQQNIDIENSHKFIQRFSKGQFENIDDLVNK